MSYATHECNYCGLNRPANQRELREVEEASGRSGSSYVYILGSTNPLI